MRRAVAVTIGATVATVALGVTPASADVIFDPADAEELATTLDEANTAQDVCYGWTIEVNNVGAVETSTGSNFGAGQALDDLVEASDCSTRIEFRANITWTSESSESEDSASYEVVSLPEGPTTADLDSLEIISENGLAGDDVDVDAYKAVAALPLLAADVGVADPIEASPAPEAEAGDAQPTNSPGSDFWRQSGMQLLWGGLLLLAGVAFAWYAISSRRRAPAPVWSEQEQIPKYVPPQWWDSSTTTPEPPEPAAQPPEPEPADRAADEPPGKLAEKPAESTEPDEPDEPGEPGEPAEKPPDTPPEKPDPETRPEG